MTSQQNISRDFKGIWIPAEVWNDARLLPMDKIIWAEIDSLYNPEKGGCFASNEYLAEFCGVTVTYISKVISKLKKCGLVCDVHFNGRQRIIKALKPLAKKDEQIKADLNCSSRQTCTTEQGRVGPQNKAPHNIYNKEDSIYENDNRCGRSHVDKSPEHTKSAAATYQHANNSIRQSFSQKNSQEDKPIDYPPEENEILDSIAKYMFPLDCFFFTPNDLLNWLKYHMPSEIYAAIQATEKQGTAILEKAKYIQKILTTKRKKQKSYA